MFSHVLHVEDPKQCNTSKNDQHEPQQVIGKMLSGDLLLVSESRWDWGREFQYEFELKFSGRVLFF